MISASITSRILVVAALASSTLGVAAVPVFAQGTPEQREACTPDALRLCSSEIPDVGRTTACMAAHRSELSPRCQATFDAGAPHTRVARTKPEKPMMRAARPAMRPPVPTHPRIVAVAPRHRLARNHVVLRESHVVHESNDKREARRVIGRLCGSNLLNADTCGFMGRMLSIAE